MDTASQDQDTLLPPAGRGWRDALFAQMFRLLHVHEVDNFDPIRYRGIGPEMFFFEQHAAYLAFFVDNSAKFFRASELLADDTSRALFDRLILFRLLGHLHVRLPYNNPETRCYRELAETWKVEDTDDAGLLGPLAIYAVPWDGREIRVKCWKENVEATFLNRQYYYDRGNDIVAPARGDHVIDAGACFGDTALGFAYEVGKSGHIYSFDPLAKHREIMRQSFAMNPTLSPRISMFSVGLAGENRAGSQLHPSDGVINPGASIAPESDIPLRTIDSLVADGTLPRIDFIKMDIEGSELAALIGAQAALKKWRPKLAISLYHRWEDLFAIPLWIDSLACGYRFFLDHYSIHQEETVLYAMARPDS